MSGRKSRKGPERAPRAQYAALPWRWSSDGGVEILLVTSRETRRWVIPKGWPIKGLTPDLSAAREAYEEAGVVGLVSAEAIGSYRYEKRLRSGRSQTLRVAVFPLKVAGEEPDWRESGERERRWMSQEAASDAVYEPELKQVIKWFNGACLKV